MTCNNCSHEMSTTDAYCPMCGKISAVVKQNTKGKLFIRLDKVIPIGISITLIGLSLLFLFLFILHDFPIVFGFSIGITTIGIALLTKFKKALQFGRENAARKDEHLSTPKCNYCFSVLHINGKYCTLCGSKIKDRRTK